jgi:hypothetical protein
MCWNRSHIAFGIAIGFGVWLQVLSQMALAETKISKEAGINANDKTVKEILAVFDRTEEALQGRNLDALMAIYSKDFNYQGLKKDDLRKIWADLFARHRRMASHHIFSKIVVRDGTAPTAEVTCTGGLWATAGTTGERVRIDSWFEEVHRLIYEDGVWRIRGHAGEDPKNTQLGVAHPFF